MDKEKIFAKYGRRFAIVEPSSIILYEIIPGDLLEYIVVEVIDGEFEIEQDYLYLEEVCLMDNCVISLSDDSDVSDRLRILSRKLEECNGKFLENDLTYNFDSSLDSIEVDFYTIVNKIFPRFRFLEFFRKK